MRYIKFYHMRNTLKEYENFNFRILLRATAESLGYLKDNQIQYDKTKEYICKYINEEFHIYDVSKKQLSRMLHPRKHRFSKYAAVYIAAMYNIMLIRWPKDLHTDVCCMNQGNKLYCEFALDIMLTMIGMFGNNMDPDVIYFMDRVNDVNNHLGQQIGILFENNYTRPGRMVF